MTSSLRLLVVEDLEKDAHVLLGPLREAGYEFSFERINTETALIEALDGMRAGSIEKKWHLVLFNDAVSEFNAKRALRIIRESNLGLPMVVVTESIDDFDALELIREGVFDLVVKNRISRIRVVIERVLRNLSFQYDQAGHRCKLSNALENTADSVMITDCDGKIEYTNKAFTEMTGFAKEEVLGKTPPIDMSERHDYEFYNRLREKLLNGEVFRDIFINRKKDNTLFYEEKTISPLRDATGKITHFISIGKDMTERIHAEEHLHQLAYYDLLTKLPNRSFFLEYMQRALVQRKDLDRGNVVFYLGLDRFNIVNEMLGYQNGNLLIQELARRLLSCVREEDTVARFGKGEFCLLMKTISTTEAASLIAGKLLSAVEEPFVIKGEEIYITASIGISFCSPYSKGSAELKSSADFEIQSAEAAMDRAKDLGGGSFQFYSKETNEKAKKRLTLENRLRSALDRDEFILHYQFQVSLMSGQIVGAEALVRWRDPELGLISPAEFIPLLEETGLIIPVGEWVLKTACSQNKSWQDAGLPKIRVGVNLSPRQFSKKDLPEVVEQILQSTNLDPKYLDIEITENSFIGDIKKAILILNKLKEMGVRLSIDDFGTGYSSLSYLQRLPFDTIKIDKSFIDDITTIPEKAAIVNSIIAMSRSMKKEVVAEGVETEAQAIYLARNHCDVMQGYYFSKPLETTKLTIELQKDRCLELNDGLNTSAVERIILFLDDDEEILESFHRLFRREGYRILTAKTADEALNLLASHVVGVIISDHKMPGMTGSKFFIRAREIYPDTIRILLSGHAGLKSVTVAINEGAVYKVLTKPCDSDLLRAHVQDAYKHYELLRDNKLRFKDVDAAV